MADEMQEIEARLAAYVDGTLPADQRAEIEAYLKANANHGRLIAELKSIKSAVVSLPKEKAPAEVLDGLQAHLERHQLLEGVEETVGASRIQRWPQFGALAAVLMLAAGLGVLVYAVLPRQKGPPPELAMLPDVLNTQPTGSDDVPAGGASLSDTGVAAKRADVLRDDQSTNAAARSAAAGQQQQYQQNYANGMAVESQAPSSAPPAMAELARTEAPKLAMAAAPQQALAGPTRVLTVTTDDPILTANLIAGYFSQANLSFQRVASVDSVLPSRSREAAVGLAADVAQEKPIPTTLPDTPTLTDAAKAQTAQQPAPAAPQPSEVVVLRQLSSQQLADAETAVRAQRFSRQRTDADWIGRLAEAKDASATQPATVPTVSFAAAASESAASSQPTSNQAAGAGFGIGGAAVAPASSQPAVEAGAMSNLVIVVVPGVMHLPVSTQPATLPASVAAPATAPTTLPK